MDRISTVKNNLPDDAKEPTWPELIKLCFKANVDLSERYWSVILNVF